jgi:hypothetical protein
MAKGSAATLGVGSDVEKDGRQQLSLNSFAPLDERQPPSPR